MTPHDASRTALATSLMRALHTCSAPAPLIHDDWGHRVMPAQIREALPDAMLRANAAFADVILRSRYTEDTLHAAMTRGIDQYVLIGAGFDSYAQRHDPTAGPLAIYEVDHPATQALKRRLLASDAAAQDGQAHYLAADLATESLATALQRSPFDFSRPAFLSWLGVTVYLPREANLATLRAIASCMAPGSELVFSYVDEAMFHPGHDAPADFRELQERAASVGERFMSGFDPAGLPMLLHELGFELLEDLDGLEQLQRYDPEGLNGLQPKAEGHIAHVRVR